MVTKQKWNGMHRRTFLSGIVLSALSAGCLGRADSGSRSDGDAPSTEHQAEQVNPLDHTATLESEDSFERTFELPSGDGEAVAHLFFEVALRSNAPEDSPGSGQVTISNETTDEILHSDDVYPRYGPGDDRRYEVVDDGDIWGDTISVRFEADRSDDYEWRFGYGGVVFDR